jgi:hypothetical protein
MKKRHKKNNLAWVVIGLILLVMLLHQTNFFSVFPSADGYIYYGDADLPLTFDTCTQDIDETMGSGDVILRTTTNDCINEYWNILYKTEYSKYDGDATSSVSGTERNILLSTTAHDCQHIDAIAYVNKNINSWDFKTELAFSAIPTNIRYVPRGKLEVYVTDMAGHENQVLVIDSYDYSVGSFYTEGLFHVKRGIINDDEVRIEYQGLHKTTFEWPYDSLYLKFVAWSDAANCGDGVGTDVDLHIKNTRYQPLFDCTLESGDLLVMEPINGPTSFDISDLSFDVKKFCLAHPAFIVSSSEQASGASAEVYQYLATGKTLTVPENEVWVLFYIMDNSENIIPTQCNSGEFYNMQTSSCVGVVNVCPGGFDVETGTCATTVETIKIQCEQDSDCVSPCEGMTVTCNLNTNLCEYNGECLYQPPINVGEQGIWDLLSAIWQSILDFINSLF